MFQYQGDDWIRKKKKRNIRSACLLYLYSKIIPRSVIVKIAPLTATGMENWAVRTVIWIWLFRGVQDVCKPIHVGIK